MLYGSKLVTRLELTAFVVAAATSLGACSAGSAGSPGTPDRASGDPLTHTLTWRQDPGTEIVQCHTFKLPSDVPVDVERIKFAFGDGSHHVHIYRSSQPEADGVTDCSAGINWPRWLLVAGAQTKPLDWQLPQGLTLPLQANQQILVQVHWLNTTAAPVDGRIDLSFYPAAHAGQPVGVVFGIDKQVDMQAAERKRVSHFCPMRPGSEIIAMMGHFHALGRAYGVWLRGADQTDAEGTQIYRGLDENTLTFESFQPAIAVGPNQGLEFQCDFVNSHDFPVTWGPDTAHQEHCNMAAYYYPAPPDDDGFCIKDGADVGTLVRLTPGSAALGAGDATELTVEMDAPVEADTNVALTASDPTALDVPAVVRIPAHAKSATVTVRALRPTGGVDVTAALGTQTAAASLKVQGLLVSELLVHPDPSSAVAGPQPWIELANVTGQPIDLTSYRLGVAGMGSTDVTVPLSGTLAPHGCMVVTAAVPPLMSNLTMMLAGLPSSLPTGQEGPVTVDLVDTQHAGTLDSVTYGVPNVPAMGPAMQAGVSMLRLSLDHWEQAMVPTPGICELRP